VVNELRHAGVSVEPIEEKDRIRELVIT
jgi:hypothetical protein